MISRQSFFRRIAAVVVAVALAPQIAFATRLPIPKPEPPGLNLQEMMDQFYAMMKARGARGPQNDDIIIYTDSDGVEACERWLRQFTSSPA